ncbi:hypothetical protein NC653_004664 [Populus alba x Populus x berolinensis]|uniref:Uncharacterized protein n=1 Tax=Populus alba x Populus x berolinensis TaxID=444605 RepID=A0AAD6WKY6_9ROSI|nr:hypothetical protein NC653_004664 [Populus alba x Populus x berolinensis]
MDCTAGKQSRNPQLKIQQLAHGIGPQSLTKMFNSGGAIKEVQYDSSTAALGNKSDKRSSFPTTLIETEEDEDDLSSTTQSLISKEQKQHLSITRGTFINNKTHHQDPSFMALNHSPGVITISLCHHQ